MFSLAACGGGGGGDGVPGGTGAPPTQLPPGFRITADMAPFAARQPSTGSEPLVQFVLDAIEAANLVHDAAAFQTNLDNVELPCQAGMRTGGLVDADGDGLVSSGDTVSITYTDCVTDLQPNTVTGRVDIRLDEYLVSADGSFSVRGVLDISAPVQIVTPSGGMGESSGRLDFAFVGTASRQQLSISISGSQSFLNVLLNNLPERLNELITNATIERRVSNARFELTTSFDLDSEFLGGFMSCTTPAILEGSFRGFPSSGTVECATLNGSAVRLETRPGAGISVTVDPESDGRFVDVPSASSNWRDYAQGTLFGGLPRRPNGQLGTEIPRIAATSMDMTVVDMLFNESAGTLLVRNDDGISEIDIDTRTVTRTLPYMRLGPMALSDDGSTLWVGRLDDPQLLRVDVAGLSVAGTLDLGTNCATAPPRRATDIAIAPGTTDTLVVAMREGQELVAYAANAELPNSLCYPSAPTRIKFRNPTTIVGVDGDDASPALQRITVDAGGLAIADELLGYVGRSDLDFELSGNRMYSNDGRVVDLDARIIEGTVDFGQVTPWSAARKFIAFEEAASIAYFVNSSGDVIDAYDTSTLTLLARYRIENPGSPVGFLDLGASGLAIARPWEIVFLQKADFVANAPAGNCTEFVLDGRFGPAFMRQIECPFSDAVYDSSRNVIYASVPSGAGRTGNAVVTVDPVTGAETARLYVGSEPTDLALSANASLLYVVLSGTNTVAVVDLAQNQVRERIRLSDDISFGLVRLPRWIGASTALDELVIVADRTDAELYSGGVAAPAFADNAEEYAGIFVGDFGETAWLVSDRDDLIGYSVSATGISEIVRHVDAMQNPGVKRAGDRFFDRRGRIFDVATASPVPGCDLFSVAVETGATPGTAYFLETSILDRIYTCDIASRSIDDGFIVPKFGGTFDQTQSMFRAGSDRLVIVTDNRLVLVDPTEF